MSSAYETKTLDRTTPFIMQHNLESQKQSLRVLRLVILNENGIIDRNICDINTVHNENAAYPLTTMPVVENLARKHPICLSRASLAVEYSEIGGFLL